MKLVLKALKLKVATKRGRRGSRGEARDPSHNVLDGDEAAAAAAAALAVITLCVIMIL